MKYFATEWLLALPLYHLLTDKTDLYGEPLLVDKMDWSYYNKLDLTLLRGKIEKGTKLVFMKVFNSSHC